MSQSLAACRLASVSALAASCAGTAKGKFVFALHSEYANPDKYKQWFGQTYDEPPAEVAAAAAARKITITARPYTDEFGTLRFAFLPIESSGKIVGMLGAG